MSTQSTKILSDIIVHSKYARYSKDLGRRESWDELVARNKQMHLDKFKGATHDKINEVYENYVRPKLVLPSMRSLQFGGGAIFKNESRIYNCAFLPINDYRAFREVMFLLLGGTGVGYSVEYHNIHSLPTVKVRKHERPLKFLVMDSIEGWADAVHALMESYFEGKTPIRFDFSDIREKGTELVVTGGKAPGPRPLKICLEKIEAILFQAVGRRLRAIEVHDICCHIADAVLSGGIRRAAMISLFSDDDQDMLECKHGSWWEDNAQRARSNNSAVLYRFNTDYAKFSRVWDAMQASGSGEPGIFWSNDQDMGTNPCAEIALQSNQFCNLTEINMHNISSKMDLFGRVDAGTFLGTMQAAYTDFHYLRPIWRTHTEEDALTGVGMTGIASGAYYNYNMKEAGEYAKAQNLEYSGNLGINRASRVTTIKPSGTSSIVLGCSSGVHAWHDRYYLRRVRVNKDEAIYPYLKATIPGLVEDDIFAPETTAVVAIPQEAPSGGILRDESAFDLFNRTIGLNKTWVKGGHVKGGNSNNVSCTISVKEHEWAGLKDLCWNQRWDYNGISFLPYDGGTYAQAPFESITKSDFSEWESRLNSIDLTQVTESEDKTNLTDQAACVGGACEIEL